MAREAVTIRKIADYLYEIPQTGQMRVPGRIYASTELMKGQEQEESFRQVANVACLPGILKYSIALPDIHSGYGFPIGGVAAFEVDGGIISPGGVGYDINCGVRLMRTNLLLKDVQPRLRELVRNVFHVVPSGVGSSGAIPKLSREEFKRLLVKGALWAVERGYGTKEDLELIEDGGVMTEADPEVPSQRACERGIGQVGTLGSGNHFIEVDYVKEVYLPEVAGQMGLQKDGVVISIHSGSRGFGYQVCDDFLQVMLRSSQRYGIQILDRQLACAPIDSPEGRNYFKALACAANYAWCNRQVMMALTERVVAKTMGMDLKDLGMKLIYDVCHNIAKFEEHLVDGRKVKVCVHRKGATRAFGPGHPLIPEVYRQLGQPVLVPGDMGRSSYLCLGTQKAMQETFGSTCHGAGRQYSRKHMLRTTKGRNLFKEMEGRGVLVMAHGQASVAEELPEAYKDAGVVVDVMEEAGISRKVVCLSPIACIKG
jgi:tRNA-splicing ligase RtcB